MPPEPDVLDPEVLKESTELSEEQREAIRDRALKTAKDREEADPDDDDEDDPFKAPLDKKKGKKKDEKADEDTEKETPAQKKDREDAEATKAAEKLAEEEAEAATAKAETLKAAREKKAEDLSEDEKVLIKEDDEATGKARTEEIDQYAEAYAEKFGLSSEQAKKEAEKVYGMLDKHKGDPREIAQAAYHLTAKLTRATEELSALKNRAVGKQVSIKGKGLLSEADTKELLVTNYRKFYSEGGKSEVKIPGIEDMGDDAIFALAWKEYEERYKLGLDRSHKDMQGEAEKKRRDVLDNLSDEDKRFVKDIRGALYRVDDGEVLSEDFDVMDYVYWARGKNYQKDVKAAVDKAVADALKNKKILGTHGSGTGTGSGAPAKKGGSSQTLSDDEKERAMDMYSSLKISDDEKFALYVKFKGNIGKKKE